jgi:hypothetical protein
MHFLALSIKVSEKIAKKLSHYQIIPIYFKTKTILILSLPLTQVTCYGIYPPEHFACR